MQAYIIHDSARTDRDAYVDAVRRLVPDLRVVQPVQHDNPMISCNLTHKFALQQAQQDCAKQDPRLCASWVMEDDIWLRPEFTVAHWQELADWLTISPYQLLLGGIATSNGQRKIADNLVEIQNFSSTHCYVLRHDAIPIVMALPAEQHFDGLLTVADIRKVVTVPFLATQWPGHSTIRRHVVDDSKTFATAETHLLNVVHG